MRTRLTDLSSATSTDVRYISYAFDCVMNLNLNGQDSRVMLSRALASTGESTSMFRKRTNTEQMFDTETVDSRPVVNRLAAALAEEEATYFYTHTCNAKDHFGVRKIKK